MMLSLLALLYSGHAFALGPIPNGTYAGTETCGGQSYATEMVFTDSTLQWDGQVNSFEFDPNGFFKVKSVEGMSGSGLGHLTKNGMHYEIVFDYPGKDGAVHPAPGEDTFTYSNGVVHLEASASAGKAGKITCTGEFQLKR